MRVLRPADNVLAFYDGRVDGYRFAADANWVDAGALSLGIASFAVVGADHAVVYDTHVSLEHARYVRDFLEAEGMRTFTVVLSHWHLDHVAGTAVFDDAEIVASERTAELLACRTEPALRDAGLRELIAGPLEAGAVHYFAAYEAVHRENVETVLAMSPPRPADVPRS